jgi:hypothetical protein
MLIFPPFQIVYRNGIPFNMGYGWLFSPPIRGSIVASVNFKMLLIQWIGVLIIGGIAVLLTSKSNTTEMDKDQNASPISEQKIKTIKFQDNEKISNGKSNVKNKCPSGVGGWLLVLVILMVFLGPLYGLGLLGGSIMATEESYPEIILNNNWHSYKIVSYIAFAISSIVSIYGGVVLAVYRDASAIKSAKKALWISGPIISIVTLLILSFFIFEEIDNLINTKVISAIIGSAIWAFIWTTYLNKSNRIRRTYLEAIKSASSTELSYGPGLHQEMSGELLCDSESRLTNKFDEQAEGRVKDTNRQKKAYTCLKCLNNFPNDTGKCPQCGEISLTVPALST